jgi:hypothetical protein
MTIEGRRAVAAVSLGAAASLALGAGSACGSRTGLAPFEGFDAGSARDAPPGIDVRPIKSPVACPDAGATLIYLMGNSNTLYGLDPSMTPPSVTTVGRIACPDATPPFSMAVDREGVAYVIYVSGRLYRVSTKTAACTPTAYDPALHANTTFGMGFVAGPGFTSDGGAEETLFVAPDVAGLGSNAELATIDLTTFDLSTIGFFSPPVLGPELTGTGDGRLFAFSPSTLEGQSYIAQIDPATAAVVAKDALPGVVLPMGNASWAFGFWGGQFYTFTNPAGPTLVQKFDPVTKAVTPEFTIEDPIVGAGVSTCAPQE